jgi:hypothetical protein
VLLPAGAAHARLAIDPREAPYAVTLPSNYDKCRVSTRSTVLICVSEVGNVRSAELVSTSLPVIDTQLPGVISRWTYQPFLVNGRAMPFCYLMNYRVGR